MDAGWEVLTGRAYDTEGMPPYLPFFEALRDYVRACPADALRAPSSAMAPRTSR